MKRTPAVSVVIPLYNKEKWVGRAVKSVLSQTFWDFELIIIDDGSTDKSLERVKEFQDDRIRIITQKNRGVSAARNRGVSEAKGRYIAFIDADDIWRERHLEITIKAFGLYPDIILSTNRIGIVRAEEVRLKSLETEKIEYSRFDYIDMLYKNRFPVHIGSILVKKEMIVKIDGFFEDMRMGEDVNLLTRVSCEGKSVISRYTGMIYNLTDTYGAMLSDRGVQYLPDYLKGLKKSKCSLSNNLKLKKFIFTEYLKKAYQNRKYPLNRKELSERGSGEYRLGVWSIIPYLSVRLMPEFIYKMIRRFKD